MEKMFAIIFTALSVGCLDSTKEESDNEAAQENSNEQENIPGECSDYRSVYPASGYGTSVGSVLEELPGMVDGDGNEQTLAGIYADTSKVALVIANAFDT